MNEIIPTWGRNRVVVTALVVLLVATGTVLWQSLGTASASAPPTSTVGARFRIVGVAAATPDPTVFTPTSHVVPNHRAVTITDVVLQNPHRDSGMMRIQIGAEVILEENLSDLRDQHYAIPLRIQADQPVVVAVHCAVPGPPEPATGNCAPTASFFG